MNASLLTRLRGAALPAVLFTGTALFAAVVHRLYPIQSWLFWRYLGYWIGALAWAAACLSGGFAVVSRVRGMPLGQQLTIGLAVGVLGFSLGIFVLGLLRCLNVWTGVALPVAMSAAGWPALARSSERLRECLRGRLFGSLPVLSLPVLGVGLLGVTILYLQLLTPENFSFDVRWYHIPMAQRYALRGAVERFEEGFWIGAYPQLTTYVYTWAFLLPRMVLFDRLELCAHLEFVLFLSTLAQIPVLVRVLLPTARETVVGLSWVAIFLFPKIFLYDSNLHAGADHVAGFFAIPIALTFLRSWRELSSGNVIVFGLCASAAYLTKYTAVTIVIPPALTLLCRGVYVTARRRDRAASLGLASLVAVPVLLTSTHWLKNFLWYGDPVFPLLHSKLALRPWTEDAAYQLQLLAGVARPGTLTREGLLEALRATFDFAFVPNDWYVLSRDYPVFGAAFTLLLPTVVLVPKLWRVAWLFALSMAAVFVWYLLSHYDRFLQTILPWMVCATAAAVICIWQQGTLARLALVPLLALQIIWGGDTPLYRTHNQINDSPLRKTTQFLASGFEGVPHRLYVYEPLYSLGKSLPRDARVLAHDLIMILGIDRDWVTDLHQTKISYGRLLTPAKVHAELTALGVTHLVWPDASLGRDSLAGDLAFTNYATLYGIEHQRIGGYNVVRLPPAPPASPSDYSVAVLACGGPYRTGLYRLSQLTVPVVGKVKAPRPVSPLTSMAAALEQGEMIVVDTACHSDRPSSAFRIIYRRDSQELYAKQI